MMRFIVSCLPLLLLLTTSSSTANAQLLFQNSPSRLAHTSTLDHLIETSAALNNLMRFGHDDAHLYWIDCEEDCTPTNSLHEFIEQDQNQTTLYLSVTQPCEDKNIPLTDFHVSTDAGRRLSVSAKVSGGESAALSKQYELPALAASALISATYSPDHVLRISIPHLSPADLTPTDVPVTVEPTPHPQPAAAAAHQQTQTEAGAGRTEEAERKEGAGGGGGEEGLRVQMERLEQELLALKAFLPR